MRTKSERVRKKVKRIIKNDEKKKKIRLFTFRSASHERRWNASPSRSVVSPSMRASLNGGM